MTKLALLNEPADGRDAHLLNVAEDMLRDLGDDTLNRPDIEESLTEVLWLGDEGA